MKGIMGTIRELSPIKSHNGNMQGKTAPAYEKYLAVLTVVAVIAGGYFVYSGMQSSLPEDSVLPPSGVGGELVPSTCPTDGKRDIVLTYTYEDVLSPIAGGGFNNQPANTSYAYYVGGSTVATGSGTTSATSSITITDAVDCGMPVKIIVGDGTNYLYQEMSFTGEQTKFFNIDANFNKGKKTEYPTATFANESNNFGSIATLYNSSMGNSPEVYMKIKAGDFIYGDGKHAVCVRYNVSIYDSVVPKSYSSSLGGMSSVTNTSSGDTLNCYEYTRDVSNGATIELALDITKKSSAYISQNETADIDIIFNEYTAEIVNGELKHTYVSTLDNTDDLGKAEKTYASAVTVYAN